MHKNDRPHRHAHVALRLSALGVSVAAIMLLLSATALAR